MDSVIGQTYSDLEIILVNDGSTDNSGAICERYVEKDKRIKYIIHQKNEGLSCARNTGLSAAAGDYILMVDGDDALHPQMIEILHHLIKSGDYDFAMCYGLHVFDLEFPSIEGIDEMPEREDLIELTPESCIMSMYSKTDLALQYHVVWNKLYKRELFSGIYYPERRNCEDIAVTHRLIFKAENITILDDKLYHHVHRDNSISNTISHAYCKDYITSLCERREDMRALGYIENDYSPNIYKVAIWILSRTQPNTELYNMTSNIFNELKQIPKALSNKQKLALFTFRINKKLFFLLCRITGRSRGF